MYMLHHSFQEKNFPKNPVKIGIIMLLVQWVDYTSGRI